MQNVQVIFLQVIITYFLVSLALLGDFKTEANLEDDIEKSHDDHDEG